MRPSLGYVAGVSFLVSLVGVGGSVFYKAPPLVFMAALFLLGLAAGWWARRSGWICGTIITLTAGAAQMIKHIHAQPGSFVSAVNTGDAWFLLFCVSVVLAGVTILGATSGVWLSGTRWQSDNEGAQ